MGMKIVAIAENDMVFENLQGEQIQEVIKKTTDKYGAEIKIIRDHGLECEGDDWRGAALKIEQQGPGWVRHDPETLAEVADADVIIVSFIGVGEQLLDAAKNLKLVAAMRSGVENVDVKACQERGVMVCNAPGRLKDPVSDFACALILDINRGITYMTKSYTPGVVQDIKPYFQPELFRDLTLGIVGLGYIGKEVARKLANFGFKFIAYDPFVTQEEADKYGVKMMSLEEVMSQADTITVHARLVPATKNMINADMIALMKPSAFFVNTARAGLEDEPALVKALQEKRIRGAALDVYWEEPLPDDHPLRKLDNVILTPHMAGVSGDSFKISMDIIMNQVGMFLGARSRHLPLGRSSSDSESAFSFAKGALMEAATSFSFLEALFIGFLYYWAYSEISLPGPWGAGIQDASTIGLLIGAFYGDWVQGLIIGASIGMLYIANGAVGANLPSDGVLAACIAVPIAIKNGLSVETAVALSIPFSLLGIFVDNGRRLVNGYWNRSAQKHVENRQYDRLWIDGILGPSLVSFCFRAIPVTLLLFLFGGAAGDVVAQFPAWLNSGLALIGAMLPGLGLMLCVIFMGKKELLPYFFVGYYIMYFTGVSYVFVCLIGVLAALLHTQFIGWKFEDEDDDDDDEDEDEETEATPVAAYGPGHAFSSRAQLIWWVIKYLSCFRMSQCIEYFYGTGIGFTMRKPLAKVYGDDADGYQTAMARHLEPFITNPCWGLVLNTASIAMEEDIAATGDPDGTKGQAIETFKTSLMGPLAGLGDGIEVGIVMPLTKSLSYPLALQGNFFGGWCMTLWFLWMLVPGIVSAVIGYETGRAGLMKMLNSGQLKKVLYGAGILGIIMMGAMAAGYCTVPLTISWETISGTTDLVSVLNGLIPGILPITYLMLSYRALNKGVKFTRLLLITCIFGLVMGILGFC